MWLAKYNCAGVAVLHKEAILQFWSWHSMTVFILHVTVHKMRLVRLVWKESGLSKPIKASELRFKRGVQDWRRCVASCSEFAVCYFDPDGLRKLIRSIATTRASVQKKKKNPQSWSQQTGRELLKQSVHRHIRYSHIKLDSGAWNCFWIKELEAIL